MGVKRQWRLMKIAELPLKEEVRRELIEKLLRQREPQVNLYCWENKNGETPEAFFSKQDAIKNWYVKQHLWKKKDIPKGVLLYEWSVPLKKVISHIKDNKILNIAISEEHALKVELPLQKLHEELQQTVQKQG